jgi:hypothetical protein
MILIENDAVLLNLAHGQRMGKPVKLARRKPGNVLKPRNFWIPDIRMPRTRSM